MNITTIQALRNLYAAPQGRAVKKQITALDVHAGTSSSCPSPGQMISNQTGITSAPETQEQMVRRYQPDL